MMQQGRCRSQLGSPRRPVRRPMLGPMALAQPTVRRRKGGYPQPPRAARMPSQGYPFPARACRASAAKDCPPHSPLSGHHTAVDGSSLLVTHRGAAAGSQMVSRHPRPRALVERSVGQCNRPCWGGEGKERGEGRDGRAVHRCDRMEVLGCTRVRVRHGVSKMGELSRSDVDASTHPPGGSEVE